MNGKPLHVVIISSLFASHYNLPFFVIIILEIKIFCGIWDVSISLRGIFIIVKDFHVEIRHLGEGILMD